MKVYMMVTKDEYSLPLMVADTIEELSEMTGSSVNSIRSTLCKYRKGGRKRERYVEVTIDDDDV